MTLFEELSADQTKLIRDWVPGPGMAVRNGVLTFAPARSQGYCVGVTRRSDFRDFSLAADVRIVSGAVGLVLRAAAPGQYYMVLFDLANNPPSFGFTPSHPQLRAAIGLELVPSAHVPLVGVWHRMQVVAKENAFDAFIGEPGGPLHHCASWQDQLRTFRQGAVGVWEHGGEAGEHRALRVETLTHEDA
jgi:hypothetical protein